MTFLLLAAAALANGAIESEFWITNVDEFIQFKDNVNSGTNYSGTTVFLDSDLSLAGRTFEPIGNYPNYFRGVFDGQGHVISNLIMTSSSQRVGLFGHSKGLTIKNVILDSSCSITSSYSSGNAWIGGIIGFCYATDGPCTIENSVNMGSVAFSGNTGVSTLSFGGISGQIYSNGYNSTVKNCANYGDVTHSGTSKGSPYVGGIVGDSWGSSLSNKVYIYNCFNYGTITHNGTSTGDLYVGGIAGCTLDTTMENCVSEGKISLLATASEGNYIGSIVGLVSGDVLIRYTYFAGDLSGYSKYGTGTPDSESNTLSYDSTSFELNGTVSIGDYTGTSFIDALNTAADYYVLREYSHWLLNKGNKAVTFTINGRTNPINMNTQVILLPSLASEGEMSFDGWYTDDGLTTPLTEFEATSDTEFYGKYCGLPKYTVTFNPRGGSISQSTKIVKFGRAYGDLPSASMTGYTFLGWFTEKYESVTAESIVEIADNHTLYARWVEISSSQVEIVFAKNDMAKEEIEEVIKKYTNADFTIILIESGYGEIRTVIEFVDEESAKYFVEFVKISSDAGTLIKRIGFVYKSPESSSSSSGSSSTTHGSSIAHGSSTTHGSSIAHESSSSIHESSSSIHKSFSPACIPMGLLWLI